MKTRNLFTVFMLCTGALGFAQTATQNYTSEIIFKEGLDPDDMYIPTPDDFMTTTYYDGFGRPIQQVQPTASPVSYKDIVTHIEYEKNIGQTKQHLPFTAPGSPGNYITDAKQVTLDYY